MIRRLFLCGCCFLTALVSCSNPTTPAAVLYFVEQEPGVEPYRTRMIVTAGFLRMDEGQDSQDFLLFDRMITDDEAKRIREAWERRYNEGRRG